MEISKEEQNAINTLKRLAKRWPESLWLYSANGSLNVMKCNSNGKRAFNGENVDENYSIDFIDIPNEGGDW